ncbi:hypothetical protein BDN70DRAFT_916900 [Pholiota conissans]|uniref:Uncharacterized protein n=1 Tax=Pholiota conissans TaxID=109636 RepID=A0A9P5ZCF1_9AGAR|nr:hypothetical protein BDN70DRAFT_916900 [Pholiota conissans]
MIAKFHSAPGHSMETTLTISLPPPQSVRAARGELPRKEKEADKERPDKKRKREEERERDKERDQEVREHERVREKQFKEHEKDRSSKMHSGGNVSYKDKFQRMREKYDKVNMSHEAHQRDLEALNAKMKKLQAENDLLLDAMYLADTALYDRFFPAAPGSMSSSLPPASVPPLPYTNQPHLGPPHAYYPELHTPSTPYPSSSHYTTMPPPGSMPPPLSSTSGTSGPPGSAHSPIPQAPHHMHSPSMAMPPPSSASTNGTVTGNGNASSSRRPSNASSRSRRRSDARGGVSSSAGVPLAPEDLTPPNGGRTPHREFSTPAASSGMDVEDMPLRSPRVNGSYNSVASAHERAGLSGGATPNPMPNGTSPSLASRRRPEVPFSVPPRDDDLPEREAHPREQPPSVDDDPAYNMTAYATVNSPDEPDEEEGKMEVDA